MLVINQSKALLRCPMIECENVCVGKFKVWALIGDRLYNIPLIVPRTFYVNSVLPPTDPFAATMGEQVKRYLPRGHQAHYVYKVSA